MNRREGRAAAPAGSPLLWLVRRPLWNDDSVLCIYFPLSRALPLSNFPGTIPISPFGLPEPRQNIRTDILVGVEKRRR